MPREIYSRNWDRMSFEEQKEYRDSKLSYFIRTQLYPYSPFYRKLFDDNRVRPESIRKAEDLRRLPFTYKDDIAPTHDDPSRFREFILRPDEAMIRQYMPRFEWNLLRLNRLFKGEKTLRKYLWKQFAPVHVQFTTGRTGFPTPILYARNDVERMTEAGRRILGLAGFGREFHYDRESIVNVMPFAPHLAFWMTAKAFDGAGVLTLHTGGGRALGTERILDAVEGFRATGIVGMPGYVYRLLRRAEEESRDFSSVRLVLVSGERIPGGMKEKMEEMLGSMGAEGCYIIGALGFTEARKGYSECLEGGDAGYHIYPDLDYLEIIDPDTDEPVGEGEDGVLAYTCLEGQGTTVIRFRTGDYVKGGIVYEPCPACGRKVPRLGSDITRSDKVKGLSLTKIKGTLVDIGAFRTVLDRNPDIREWQVEIKKEGGDPYDLDVVDVYVAPAEGAREERLREEIESAVQLATEVKPNSVVFLAYEDMVERLKSETGIKELRVFDNRPEV